ncbi:MAG: hypothetical protein HYU84_00780 [Chloroflexi bacterium]|nr:hypothetical protein [Chloroflexota bacterium]
MQKHKRTTLALFAIFLLLSACSSNQPADLPTPTEQIFLTLPVTDTPAAPTETPLPTNTPFPTLERAKYTLNTNIDYDAHTVTVDQIILYPNLTGNQLNALVLAVTPNLWDGSFSLTSLAIDGEPVTT